MDLKHLQIFVNLAETLNYSKTAQNLHISQPAISQIIVKMEQELGVKLFIRNKHSVNLTKNGRIFYQNIKVMLNTYNKTVQQTREAYNRERSNLTIGITDTPLERYLLPKLIGNFHKTNPDIKIFLESYDHIQLKRHLQQHNNDLIFTTQDDISDNDNITFYPLLHGQFNLLIPRTCSNLVDKQQIKFNDLQNQTFILMDNNWCPPQQLQIQEKIRKTVSNLDITYVNNVEVAFTMVQAGLGITIMPNFIAGNILKNALSIPLVNSVQLTYGIALLNSSENDIASAFAKYAMDYCNRLNQE
ncbi:LysR family transcriptional regulator [uncultured Lactobacillus sp.]|uniref:LysR family transcriptional regulator n=1 Tax=uncultured Lactobacillus sp. TaxID=153152 RepID=UPI00259BDE73|nr:LysR family transcriptional regulator [uncultured Lactobacillus sp.]